MMQCRAYLAFFCSMLCFQVAHAQTEATLHFMNSLPQSVYNNPAFFARYRFSFGLPGSSVYGYYSNKQIALKDFISYQKGNSKALLDNLYAKMGNEDNMKVATNIDLFRISAKAGARAYFTWNVTMKTRGDISLPKEMVGMYLNGGSAYTNSNNISFNPKIDLTTYMESGWSLAYKINKDFTFGVRYKMIKGLLQVTSGDSQINLTRSASNVITSTAKVNANSSGVKAIDSLGFTYVVDHWQEYMKNSGYGIDVGFTYRAADRLTLGLSALDIGKITWKHDLFGYVNANNGSYSTQGIDLDRIINGDKSYLNAQIDSLEAHFKLKNVTSGSYTTTLPMKAYFSANYEIKRNFTLGVVMFGEKDQAVLSGGGSISLHKEFGRRVSGSLSYTYYSNSYNNIGTGISLNFAPLQVYIVGDNLLRAPYYLLTQGSYQEFVNTAKYVNVRAGVNFVFGWEKWQDRAPYMSKNYPIRQR